MAVDYRMSVGSRLAACGGCVPCRRPCRSLGCRLLGEVVVLSLSPRQPTVPILPLGVSGSACRRRLGAETDGGPILVGLMEVMEHGLPLSTGCSLVLVASSA